MNTLFTNISGQGAPLVALHGWGMNHNVWLPVKEKLESHFRVTWVDLPGHGQSRGLSLGTLDDVVEAIKPLLEERGEPVHLMGWSLGGLIAQRLAQRFSDHVASLILVATSPSFVRRDQWPHAMPIDVLNGFRQSLESNFALTLKLFLTLQFMGVKGVKADVKRLTDELLRLPPNVNTLRDGLAILQHADLRMDQISTPKHWVLGALDKLIPASVKNDLELSSEDSITIMQGAGHAPFISHADEFVDHLCKVLLAGDIVRKTDLVENN